MNNSEQHLKIKELRDKISKKPEIVDKIKAIEEIGQKYKLDVLLVDDDPSGNFLSKKYLEGSSKVNNIKSMICPLKALDHLNELHDSSKHFPRLILLDIEMPLMNGHEFLEKFKEKFPRKKTKIILFTAHKEDFIKKELEYKRVIGFLHKPLDIKKFEKMVKSNFS